LGKPGYMDAIIAGTRDVLPTLIFNNAGYVSTGLFSDSALDSLMANYECNATAPVHVTHHFVQRILAESKRTVAQRRGGLFFTSSPAGVMPCPTTVMYGATKAFLTEFATSVSAEVWADGIDTLVVHPSPVDTGFYSGNKHDMSAMKFFQRTATSPESIASCFFKSAGRSVVCDQGYFSIALRMLLKLIDYNFIALLITRTSTMSGDYVKLAGQRKKKE
jgi:short-subunit dehydrogenase